MLLKNAELIEDFAWWRVDTSTRLPGTDETHAYRVIAQLPGKEVDTPRLAWDVAIASVGVANFPPESIVKVTKPERPHDRLTCILEGSFLVQIERRT
jgi:hypothetical protein